MDTRENELGTSRPQTVAKYISTLFLRSKSSLLRQSEGEKISLTKGTSTHSGQGSVLSGLPP